jgi:uncharacterized protein YndB with AHSA1/START domain
MTRCATQIEQTIPAASAQELWAQWIDPDKLAVWFWPLYPDTVYEIDPRQGGRFRFYSKKTGVGAHGEIKEFSPGSFLSLAWFWEDEAGGGEEETVNISFSDGLIRLEHSADSLDSCTMYQNVWTDILYRLKGVLTK